MKPLFVLFILLHFCFAFQEEEWKERWWKTKSQTDCMGEIRIEHRDITQKGFHTRLKTNVSFVLNSKESKKWNRSAWKECSFIQLEELTCSFFVDKYQIRDEQKKQFNSIQQVSMMETIDLEKPSYYSHSNPIFIHSHFQNQSQLLSSPFHWNSDLPIHLRYHPPSNHSQAIFDIATIEEPSFYLNCKLLDGTAKTKKLCIYKHSSSILINVPVGNLEDQFVVTAITLISSCVGCLLLLCSTVSYSKQIQTS